MAHRNGKRYPEEFKKQIVDLYNAGTPVAKLASEYGLVDQTIYKWIKLYSPITETDEEETVSMKNFKQLKKNAYSARTAHPFRKNGAPFRLKLSSAQFQLISCFDPDDDLVLEIPNDKLWRSFY